MAVVYRAFDSRQRRNVAIKVLHPEVAAAVGEGRFRQEVLLASRMVHPGILPVLDSGELIVDGVRSLWYAMPLVEGATVRDRLPREGTLPIDEVTRIGREVAEALNHAHASGVVHRDVKPENILMVDGRPLLADFGIARLIDQQSAERLTATGLTIGTPSYMSPEQATTGQVDVRSDVFSLGAVLYEALAGEPPYTGPNAQAILARMMTESPRPISGMRPSAAALEPIVLRSLARNPADRFASAADFARALADVREAPARPRAGSRMGIGLRLAPWVLGVIVLGVGGWMLSRTPSPPVEGAAQTPSAPLPQERLAVLPFENLSRQPADDWMAGALAEALTSALQPVRSVVIVPRERVYELYRAESVQDAQRLGPDVVRELARRLGVTRYVHGSFQRVGSNLRIVARLVAVNGESIQHQASVTGAEDALLQLEDDLAQRMAVRFDAGDITRDRRRAPNLATYRALGRAQEHYARGEFEEARVRAAAVVQDDSGYAAAWALLSMATSRLASPAGYQGGSLGQLRIEALAAARRAVALAPEEYEMWIALSLAHRATGAIDSMLVTARQAQTVHPRGGQAHSLIADAVSPSPGLYCRGRSTNAAQAEAGYRLALDLDPLDATNYVNLGTMLLWSDRADEAAGVVHTGVQRLPGNTQLPPIEGFMRVFSQEPDAAARILEPLLATAGRGAPAIHSNLGLLALRRGNLAEAQSHLAIAEAAGLFRVHVRSLFAAKSAFLGGLDSVGLAYLKRAAREDHECTAVAMASPWFRDLRTRSDVNAALAATASANP